MKRILRLIALEASFLKRTITLIGIILIAFVAALLSVISVLIDVPDGMYSGLDEYANIFVCSVDGVSTAFSADCGGTPLYGKKIGLTEYATLTGATASLNTNPPPMSGKEDEKEESDSGFSLKRSGCAVNLNEAEALFSLYNEALNKNVLLGSAEARWPSTAGEIVLSSDIALFLGLRVGETLTIGPDLTHADPEEPEAPDLENLPTYAFTVVGTYDPNKIVDTIKQLPLECVLPYADFYLALDPEMTVSSLTFSFPDTKTLHDTYRRLEASGYGVELSALAERQFNNIALAAAFFGAVSGVLGAMVLFILYSLIAIFYRQRKQQICRLKLLGATSGTVAWIYCSIAVLLVVISVAIGTAFSMLFNVYFMNLCAQLFDKFSSNFVSHFRPIIPFWLFLILTAYTLFHRKSQGEECGYRAGGAP